MLTKASDIRKFLGKLQNPTTLDYVDVETTGLKWMHDDVICGVAVKLQSGEKHYIPIRHQQGKNANPDLVFGLLKPALENPNKWIGGHGFKFDAHEFEQEGIDVQCKILDSQIGCHLVNENEKFTGGSYKLEDLTVRYVDPTADYAEKEMLSKIGTKDNLWKADPKDVSTYAEQDVESTEGLVSYVYKKLKEENMVGIWREFADYILDTVEMEKNGVLIDARATKKAIPETERIQDDLLFQLEQCTEVINLTDQFDEKKKKKGERFNPNSTIQVCKLFGIHSSSRDILEDIGGEVADLILEYRRGTKINGSFLEPFLSEICADGRLRAQINLHATVNGRPSCSNPVNLQALPKKDDIFKVRSKIIAAKGFKLISVDYSQIELRLLAHYTGDELFVKAYQGDGDIHQLVADELGLDRDIAKRMNLGTVYGLGADGLARKAKLSEARARAFLARYHDRSPGVRRLYNKCQSISKKQGYIQMWTGRRRRFTEEWEHRKAMSSLIQGGVGEIMRKSVGRNGKLFRGSTDVKPLLQVHDEQLFEVREDLVDDVIPVIVKNMVEGFDFRVPLGVEVKVGNNWGEVKPWKQNK